MTELKKDPVMSKEEVNWEHVQIYLEQFVGGRPVNAETEEMREMTKLLGEDFIKINLDKNGATLQLKPAGWALRRIVKRIVS